MPYTLIPQVWVKSSVQFLFSHTFCHHCPPSLQLAPQAKVNSHPVFLNSWKKNSVEGKFRGWWWWNIYGSACARPICGKWLVTRWVLNTSLVTHSRQAEPCTQMVKRKEIKFNVSCFLTVMVQLVWRLQRHIQRLWLRGNQCHRIAGNGRYWMYQDRVD